MRCCQNTKLRVPFGHECKSMRKLSESELCDLFFSPNHWAQLCVLSLNMSIFASQSDLSVSFLSFFLSFKMSDAQGGFVVSRLPLLVSGHLNQLSLTQDDQRVVS